MCNLKTGSKQVIICQHTRISKAILSNKWESTYQVIWLQTIDINQLILQGTLKILIKIRQTHVLNAADYITEWWESTNQGTI